MIMAANDEQFSGPPESYPGAVPLGPTYLPGPPTPYGRPPGIYGQVPFAQPGEPPAMPDGPREYPQLLRGARNRWWKPLLSIPLFAALVGIVINLLSLLLLPIGALTGHRDLLAYMSSTLDVKHLGPVGFAFTNLSLIVLIPAAMFTVWAVHRTKPRFLISVAGRFRWRWFARCLLVVVPLWVIYLGVGTLLDPPTGGRPPHWLALLIIVIISTPLQAAGEEFAFRGFLTQVVGSWFRRPIVSALVPLPFSVGLFALAHGSLHLWILVDLGSFALATYILTWRTGGLEAGICLHAVNNMLIFLITLNLGGWQDSFVQSSSTGSASAALTSLAANAVVTALLLWQAKRVDLNRLYRPIAAAEIAAQQSTGRPIMLTP